MLWTGGSSGQFTDGGDIAMACGECDCSGTSDAGSVIVFEDPSSGGKVAFVDGELSEVVDTSCGKSVIAVGTTIFELSGVDFGSRELDVVDMLPGGCTIPEVPSTADCFSGESSHVLSNGEADGETLRLTLTFCMCVSDSTGPGQLYVNVKATASGASKVSIPNSGLGICPDNGYKSQLVTAEIDGEEHFYNFDLVEPGEEGSAGLLVGPGPSAAAQAFICGEEVVITPAPLSPVVDEPVPGLETPAPATPPVEEAATPAPSEPPRVSETPGPAGSEPCPAPVTATVTGAPAAAPSPPSVTPGPTLAETLAPLTEAELEQVACKWPMVEPCTPTTPVARITKGMGAFYDPNCTEDGCDVGYSGKCRICFFDTLLYREKVEEEQGGTAGEVQLPDYVQCPCCVLEVYGVPFAQDEDGPRCVNATPAPTTTALGTGTEDSESLGFEDNPMTLAGGEAVALGALGLFALLTFTAL